MHLRVDCQHDHVVGCHYQIDYLLLFPRHGCNDDDDDDEDVVVVVVEVHDEVYVHCYFWFYCLS